MVLYDFTFTNQHLAWARRHFHKLPFSAGQVRFTSSYVLDFVMSIKKYDAEANFLLFAASILCGKNHVMATRRPHSTFPGAPTTHISCTFVSGKRFSHLRHCFFDLPSRLRSPIEGWARASLRLALAAAGKRSGGLILDRVASGEQLRMQLRSGEPLRRPHPR